MDTLPSGWHLGASRLHDGFDHALLTRLLDGAGIVPWEAEPASDGRKFVFIGDNAAGLFGYALQDWYRSDFWPARIHSEDREEILRECRRQNAEIGVAAGEEFFEMEYRFLRPDGSFTAIRDISRFFFLDGQPRLTGFFYGIPGNSTPSPQLQKGLQAQHLALMVDENPLGVIEWTPDLRVVHWNPAAERIFGYSESEAVGQSWEFIVPSTEEARIQASWERLVQNRGGFRVYNRNIRKDGLDIECEWYNKPLISGNGDLLGILSLVDEVTAERLAYRALERMNAQLERRVAQRTAELAAVNEELESFAYSVSHDLRAPLRAIDGFSDALLDDCASQLGPEATDYLLRIRNAGQRMAELINDLLDLSRVNRGELQIGTVDLSNLVHEAMMQLRQSFPGRVVECEIEPNLVAEGDRRLLRILVENLLSNAWKYTGKTVGAKIQVQAFQEDGRSVFCVRDNGVGFDPRYRDKLFKPFQRLHRQEDFPGHGIGLATVKRIVTRLGGRIWADALPGSGATFFFTLAEFEPMLESGRGP